jgi:hypothetical protein
MPNWCNNTVELYHEDKEMINRAKAALERGEFLNEFIPVPEELKIVAGRVGDNADENQKALELQQEANLQKHGYSTWYDFCINEWGCKWDVGGDSNVIIAYSQLIRHLTASFDSPWGPPIQAYEKLEELGFEIRAYYYEPGMQFCGCYEGGYDDYYNLGGMDSAEVAETIPSELDEMFYISEQMQEWELENEEEEEENE